jgi:primosomal protein N' (replication factor Y)
MRYNACTLTNSFAHVVVHVPLTFSPPPENAAEISPAPYEWVERSFTYRVPDELQASLRVGQLVWVPFGARRLQGIVIGLAEHTEIAHPRALQEIVATQPFVTPAQIELARWMARYYLAPLADCVWLFLPPGIEAKSETILEPNAAVCVPDDLTAKQRALLEKIAARGGMKTTQLALNEQSAADALVRRGLLVKNVRVRPPTAKPRRVHAVRLRADLESARAKIAALVPPDPAATVWSVTEKYQDTIPALPPPQARVCVYLREHGSAVTSAELKTVLGTTTATLRALEKGGWVTRTTHPNTTSALAARWNAIVEFLAQEPDSVWVSAVYAATNATRQDLKKLEGAGIVALESAEYLRDPLAHKTFAPVPPPTLTREQDAVWQEIRRVLQVPASFRLPPSAFLLHGVTGSGKTEIYLDAIASALTQGEQAIALIPEISLTPQTIRRFGARFGERIGVLHSQLSPGERYDTWRRIRDGKIDVVIGPRSALFAPLPRLGLVIVDEEHDASYKSDPAFPHMPAYHAREVALRMAQTQNLVVILGSATPDVETFARAQRGELKLLELPQRIIAHEKPNAPVRYQDLPPVEIVDLRAELVQGNRSMFSRALRAALDETLARGEQAILFLNRRGTAQAVVCRDCGHVLKCPRCSNPFTLHTFGNQTARDLVCHHCGKHGAMPRKCPHCGGTRIRGLGVGTEKLEEAVRAEFPRARTLRWDLDVTRGKGAHEEILEAFLRGEANVLIGTQMIAKGLDLPRVTLVGVMNADTSLFLPDFRASERTFQLLTQVAGRAGRSALGGRAILQTYNPDHYSIQTAARHAYHEFFQREIAFRRTAGYPPMRPLTRLLFTGDSAKGAREASETLARFLRDGIRRHGILDVELIGPSPAFFAKLRGKYRQHILLKGAGARELLALYPLPYGWRIDVDPLDLL